MLFNETLKIGEIFEVEAGSDRVHTKLQEMMESGEFVVLEPTIKGVPLRPQNGEQFKFSFFRPTGVYMFQAELIEPFTDKNIRLCRFRQTTETEKIQRRHCYRLPIVLDMQVLEGEGEDEKKYRGKTITLSEKSVEFSCFAEFAEEQPLCVKIFLSKSEIITLYGNVIKFTRAENKTEPNEAVVLFSEISARYRTRMSRFIFTQQIVERNKRKPKLS